MIIKTDKSEIMDFFQDASNFKGDCEAVYFPKEAEEVKQILIDANKNKTHVTISGNGTGLTGARVPEDGIVISTNLLNKIIEINETNKYAVIEPGVILKDFQDLVESKGLFYPPDPTERNCFVGATVANNSSGAKTFKYGPTRDYVEAANIILPDGEEVYLNRGDIYAVDNILSFITKSGKLIKLNLPAHPMPETKHTAGYYYKPGMDAIDLFIGSEGTLGFLSEIKLKLIDLPRNILSSIIFFDDEMDALNFITEVRESSKSNRNSNDLSLINALGLEFFDNNSLKFMIEEYTQIPQTANAAVWFEQEIDDVSEEEALNNWMELIEKNNGDLETAWIATNEKDRTKFKDFRHAISWKVTEYITRENVRKVGTDTAVPDNKFLEYYNYIITTVKSNGLNYICYGHAGNSHVHLNMLPKNETEYLKARKIYADLCSKAVEMNGTISAEHGIGKLKRNFLNIMFNETEIKEMAQLKKALDPNLILGIGNIFETNYFDEK